MFVICFGDGLGNQMFQYAFYMSMKNAYPNNYVKMDVFFIYGGKIHNGFELNKVFNIPIDACSHGIAMALSDYCPMHIKKYNLVNSFQKIRRCLFGFKESYITQDDPTCYYDEVYRLSELKSYIFRGNWINENYFSGIEDEVKKTFVFPPLFSEKNKEYAKRIQETNSVSVHIRKGDYLKSEMIDLPVNYYQNAKTIVEKSISNPEYFIFTDDSEAIKEYLAVFKKYVIVEGNYGDNSFRDMQLMSMCKHNIIANSTFSFWGAFLNDNQEKIVVAPDKAKKDFKNPFAMSSWTIIPYDDKY